MPQNAKAYFVYAPSDVASRRNSKANKLPARSAFELRRLDCFHFPLNMTACSSSLRADDYRLAAKAIQFVSRESGNGFKVPSRICAFSHSRIRRTKAFLPSVAFISHGLIP
jgi:hypothetical protein